MTRKIPAPFTKLCPLSLAIAATMACSASAWAQSMGPVVADGNHLDVISGSYETAVDGASGYVFHALNGGSLGSRGPVSLNASGANTSAAVAEYGGLIVLAGGSVSTTGDSANGVSMLTGGKIELLTDSAGQGVAITTTGQRSNAANVDAGTLIARDAMLSTTGAGSHGLYASGSSQATIQGGHITTSGRTSHAVMADGGTVELLETQIKSEGAASDALYALNGGQIEGDNLTVTASGGGGAAARVSVLSSLSLSNSTVENTAENGKGVYGAGHVTLTNTDIHVSGAQARAVELSGGVVRIEGGSIRADHERAEAMFLKADNVVNVTGTSIAGGLYGININGNGNDVLLTDVDILTDGFMGTGIFLPSSSTLTMNGGSITTVNDSGVGIDNRKGFAALVGVQLRTSGASAHGLYASMDNGSVQPVFQSDRTTITTSGIGSIGSVARLGGSIHLHDSSIVTSGVKGYGVLSGGTGEMRLSNTHVRTSGVGAYAGVVNASGSLEVDGGSLVSERHAALWVRAARQVSVRNGASLIGGNGTLMAVDAAFASPFELSLDQDVYAQGDIVITPEDLAAGVPVVADIRLSLGGHSHWMGSSTLVNQVALANESRWTLTGDSTVGQLELHGSTLALSVPGATAFNRLTVDGNFEATNSLLIFNGTLGDDSSLIDFLHVRGDTIGNAAIQVNNVHGLGAQTANGIQLVQVDGVSDAVYAMSGRAVAGSYDYFLYKGGISSPDDGGWYLRSELTPIPPDPCDADPTGPGCVEPPKPDPCEIDPSGPGCVVAPPEPTPCDSDPTGPDCSVLPPDPCEADANSADCGGPRPPQVIRPEAGAYLANQAAAVSLFEHRLQDRDGAYAEGDAVWLRVKSSHTRQDVAGQLALTGRASTVMGGMDLLHWGVTSKGSAGVLLAAGQASTNVRSRLSGYTAEGTVKGGALGVYATWWQRPAEDVGAYVDASIQHGRYRNETQGIGLAKERNDARTNAASLETGYTWSVGSGGNNKLMVQPQLQMTYTDYRADDVAEHNGTRVSTGAAGGLSTRLGVRVSGDARSADRRVQPYISANWLRDGGNRVWMDDALIEGAAPANRYEVRAGTMLLLGNRWSAWGEFGLQRGDGGYRSASAQLGLRASW